MATTTRPVSEQVDLVADKRRPMRVCAYVDLPFEEVVARLGASSAREMLAPAVHAALGLDDDDVRLDTHGLALVAGGVARLTLSWRTDEATAGSGAATVSVLSVQRGHDALTEILVEVPVEVATAPLAAAAVRRFLAELDNQLTAAATR